MAAADGVVLAPGGHVEEPPVSIELEAIGRHLALRDRGPQSPRRVHEHAAIGRAAQSAARRRARGPAAGRAPPWRYPPGRHRESPCSATRASTRARPSRRARRSEIRPRPRAQVALELPGEAGSVAILDERRGAHDGQRAGASDEVAPRREQRLAARPARSAARAVRASSAARAAALRPDRLLANAPRADASRPSAAT